MIESRESKYKLMLENMEHNTPDFSIVKSESTAEGPRHNHFVALDEKEWMQKELDIFIDGL